MTKEEREEIDAQISLATMEGTSLSQDAETFSVICEAMKRDGNTVGLLRSDLSHEVADAMLLVLLSRWQKKDAE